MGIGERFDHVTRGRTPDMADLRAGVGRVDITPPLPADLVGFVRRAAPAVGVLAPLTATALVLEDRAGRRAAIVAFDLIAISPAQGEQARALIAEQIGASPDAVFLSYSHTHAGPHSTAGSLRKLAGTMRTIFDKERVYIESLPDRLCSAATIAAQELVPVRVAGGSTHVPGLSVNRRERTEDGRTILGWNKEGALDDELTVVKFETAEGSTLALLASFACHPVVVGPENPNVGPDFPGALRALVERTLGCTCLYLTGAAGNVLPLEGFQAEAGPEIVFGERLGYAALDVASSISGFADHVEKVGYGSVTPISLYRRVADSPQPTQQLAWASTSVELPLKPLPTIDEVERLLEEYRGNVERAVAEGRSQAEINPIDYHLQWAERSLERLKSGEEIETSVAAYVQAIRIGDVAIVGIPGEPFNEIGRAVKDRSAAPLTLFAGYSNGYIGYFPTAAEYPYGGYEPSYSHHNTDLLEQVAPESEQILTDAALAMIERTFSAGAGG